MMERVQERDLMDPDRKRLYNERLFAVVAPRYDIITRLLSLGRDGAWKRRLVRLLPGRQDCDALDLASGTGDILFALALRYPKGRVVGIDLSPQMISRARRRVVSGRALHIVRASMDQLPFDDEGFDVVTGGYALRNAPDLSRVLAEVARVLRPGGHAVFLDFSRSPNRARWQLERRLLRFWGALWGVLLHRNPEVYAYIARSLAGYPDRTSLAAMLSRSGFVHIRSHALMGGFLALTGFRKPTR
jgi:demethylmenaquinone methyltransferase/2-methoxy-6-polyprenyl-1,4-benzoquinol methylase